MKPGLTLAIGIAGICSSAVAAKTVVRTYDYTLQFGLSPAVNAEVQREHLAICNQLGPSRCRVRLSRISDMGDSSGALTVEARRDLVPHLLASFDAAIKDAGGRTRRSEMESTESGDGGVHADTASISMTYIGIPGFSEQVGEAIRTFLPTMQVGLVSMVFLLPALGPWLAAGGLIFWGIRTAWRRRRRLPV